MATATDTKKPRMREKFERDVVPMLMERFSIKNRLAVPRLEKHRLYKKYVRKRTVLKAHDEKNEAKIGAVVELEFARPLSKTKRWNLVRILRQGDGG